MMSVEQSLEQAGVYDLLGPHRFTPSRLSTFYEELGACMHRGQQILENVKGHPYANKIVVHEVASDLCSRLKTYGIKATHLGHSKNTRGQESLSVEDIISSYAQEADTYEQQGVLKSADDVLRHAAEYFSAFILSSEEESSLEYSLPNHLLPKEKRALQNVKKYTFNDVIGLERQKELLRLSVINTIQKAESWAHLKEVPEKTTEYRSLLFHGPPGTGKTYLGEALAGELGAVVYSQKGSDFVQSLHGEGKNKLEELFAKAAKHPHGLVIIDEADSIIKQRGVHGTELNVDATTSLLYLLGDTVPYPNVTTVLSTNMKLSAIDYALRGRIGSGIIEFGFYSVEELSKIIELNKSYYTCEPSSDEELLFLAEQLPQKTGRAAKQLVTQAALRALDEDAKSVRKDHFEKSLEDMLHDKQS